MPGWFWKIYFLSFSMATKRKIISIHEKKAQRFAWIKFFYWAFLLSFFWAIFYSLFLAGFLSINKIDISGVSEIDRQNILNVINPGLEGKYLGIVSKNNLILVNSRSVEKDLTRRFVKIESVKVRKKFPNMLIVEIGEKESSMILCLPEDCYMLDKKGVAYSKLDYSLPEVSENRLAVLNDLSGKNVNVGSVVFSAEYLKYIQEIEEKMPDVLDIYMEKNYETPSRVSPDVRGTTKEGWKVFFNISIDIQKEIDMLKTVLDEKIGDRKKDLEYVDLRSENKVYYKFKQGTQEEMNKEENNDTQPAEENKVDKKDKKKKK
jgi:cell division septal protein FtsQ